VQFCKMITTTVITHHYVLRTVSLQFFLQWLKIHYIMPKLHIKINYFIYTTTYYCIMYGTVGMLNWKPLGHHQITRWYNTYNTGIICGCILLLANNEIT
jgi:hypothetical protein